ncbi:hypothetical protein CBR_g48437 [Chara braunii]|uniref:LisH domain-containing protein n=1 Tax=Chara braunii TaxID=69332 RepID=A0A388M2Y2_CHABU|nr:hypothetical protein CBR_g48437 [Chara braunii]|eukprot:GBG88823.1 hypothetical protein CBR_g48437 [Chara braunii]
MYSTLSSVHWLSLTIGFGDDHWLNLEADSDDDFKYEEVEVESDEEEEDDQSEDLESALQRLNSPGSRIQVPGTPQTAVKRIPEVIDDFIRNFLIKMGLMQTLEAFEVEWHEHKAFGKLPVDLPLVPSVYQQNQKLMETITDLRREYEKAKQLAEKARVMWEKFRKERDFHRMHHKRVTQEKNRLILDVKRLREHYAKYEPTILELRTKHETALKEKMLMKIDRDRLEAKVNTLEMTIKTLEAGKSEAKVMSDTKKAPAKVPGHKGDAVFPSGASFNPYWNTTYEPPRNKNYLLAKTFRGHAMPEGENEGEGEGGGGGGGKEKLNGKGKVKKKGKAKEGEGKGKKKDRKGKMKGKGEGKEKEKEKEKESGKGKMKGKGKERKKQKQKEKGKGKGKPRCRQGTEGQRIEGKRKNGKRIWKEREYKKGREYAKLPKGAAKN